MVQIVQHTKPIRVGPNLMKNNLRADNTKLMEFAITYEPKDKKVVVPKGLEAKLDTEVDQLNTLITEIISNGADVPPVASVENFNKDLSKLVKKLYEGGVAAFKQNKFEEAVKQFTVGIQMIARRHKFESFQGTLQELSMFLMSRTDAYLKVHNYLGAFNDVDMLIGMQVCTPDNFLRRGVSNFFLGNYEAARADYQRGLAFAPNHPRLEEELEVCLDKILEENGDYL